MNRKLALIISLFLFVGIVGGFCVKIAQPSKEEIESQTPEVVIVKPEIFKSKIIQGISQYRSFGALPVRLDKSEQGKNNPFAP